MTIAPRIAALVAGAAAAAAPHATAADGLRVVTWNITYYAGDRAEQIGTVAYGQWNGRSLDPDVICLQEMVSRQAVLALVAALNAAPGSPQDWAAAPVFTNAHSAMGTALVYRTGKLTLDSATLVSPGGPSPAHPRNLVRFDMRPVGYEEDASIISVYPLHFQAFTGAVNEARRLDEAQALAANLATLPPGRHVVVGADFNIRDAQEAAYRVMNGQPANTGPLLDPISTPGRWNNNPAFRNVHTQDPTGDGGMDDRYDQILLSPSLLDGVGMDYDGDFPTPWNLLTPEDPAHSYRAWGNDGTTYNQTLRVAGNTMVGPVIAQAIRDMALGGGHIPVYLDLDLPGRLRIVQDRFDLGDVPFGQTRTVGLRVANAADADRWGPNGIAPLRFEPSYPPGVTGPSGPQHAPAGGQTILLPVEIDSAAWPDGGSIALSIGIASDDPARPEATVEVNLRVVGCSTADLAPPLGSLSFPDFAAFVQALNAGSDAADLAQPFGVLDFFDAAAFVNAYQAGCDPEP